MRTDQPSPLYNPSSPLSPTSKPAPTPLSPRPTTRRGARNTNCLRLANLNRFTHASPQTTSTTADDTSKPSLQTSGSKLSHHSKPHSDAQMALHNFQRELIAGAARSSRTVATTVLYKPLSPRLLPLGSPGPVTPLLLEEGAGYMVAGAVGRGVGLGEGELVESLAREEERRGSVQAERAAAVEPAGGRR